MKFKKLLVLSALWLTAMSAMAAIADVREKPAFPATQGFVASEYVDDYFYLFNVDAQAFFTEGNAWGTQVSLGATGLKVAFTPDGDAYLFNDFSIAKNAWKNVFFDNENQMFVDLGSQANYRWGVEQNGDTFRLFAAGEDAGNPGWDNGEKPAYREGQYVGWVKGSNSSACVPYLPVAEENCINWAFVTEENYAPYAEAIVIYNAAQALKTQLEKAEELGANIAAQLEVYNNLASTVEELNAAAEALKPIIEARQNLKKGLDDAKAGGFNDTAEYDAVFANGDATKAQLEKALADLNAALVEWGKTHASVENPADMTSKITNPNYDNASYAGWLGTAPNMTGSGSHGPANVPEKWNDTFDTYQEIADLPAGVYALGAQTMWRGSYNDMKNGIGPASKLYATVGDTEFSVPFNYAYAPLNTEPMAGETSWGVGAGETSATDEETGITYYIPNDPSCFRVYAEKGLYDTQLLFGVSEGTVRIGVKNPAKMGDADNWSVWDTFTLKYYGAGADAAQLYLDESMKNFSEVTIPEGTIFTDSYLTAYEEAYSGEKTADNFEDAVAIVNGVSEAKKALDKNIQLWKDWQDLNQVIQSEYLLEEEYQDITPEIDDLADYAMEVEDFLAAHEWTNEELQAEMDKLNGWVTSLVDKSKQAVWDNKNMTKYINNPTFESSTTKNTGNSDGWTVDRISGGNVTPGPIGGDGDTFLDKCGYYNGCFESWHCHKWDVWQEVKGLPVGMYELEVQGYVRCEVSGYNKGDELVEPYTSPVYLYMNNAMSQFPSVYSEVPAEAGVEFQIVESWTQEEVNGNYFPNSMGGAAQCFHIDKAAGLNGMYKTTAYGLIAKEGDTFRIGVKMDANQDWWCIWDNFKLTYKKPTVDIVKPELEKAIAQIDFTQPMGKSVYAKATEAIATANAAKESNDAQGMFDALAGLYEVSGEVIASTAKFTALQTVVRELEDAAFISDSPAKNEALALVDEINGGIASYSYEDAEVEGLKEQIYAMYTKMNMPTDMASASDENPVECTNVMKSPSFEDADMLNSSTGWTNPGNLGNDDTQKAALAMEFWQVAFDMYQTIYGLPKGTYRLTVDAWCRNGGGTDNYNEWVADPKATMAYVYAVDGDSTVYASPVANLMAGAISAEDPGIDGVGEEIIEGTSYYLPNSLIGGWSYIQYQSEPVYTNEVICKVGDDGKLTVGMKKAEEKGNSWVVLDNFRLFYLGTNSSATPSDGTAINTLENGVAAVKVEFFNLNGARINKPGKGVALMKQTLSDGSVKLQKVIIK
jgi:hypothetical protein